MDFRIVNVIIAREYLTKVRKKSFLLTTFLGPVFFAALCILPSLIMLMAEDKGKRVGVVDQSGIVMPYMVDSEQTDFMDFSGRPVDSLKNSYFDLDLDALVLISGLDTVSRTVSVSAYSQKPLSVDMKETLSRNVSNAVEEYRLESYDIKGLRQILEDVRVDIPVATYTMDASGQEKITSSEVYMAISLVFSVIIYMFIAMFSAMVMQSVIEEKSTRVVEVLISSVDSLELMFGKIIGVAAVALTQFFLWIVLTAVIVLGVSPFVGMDTLAASTAAMSMTPEMNVMPDVSTSGELAAVMSTLSSLNYGEILLSFLIYFVLGYLLYASLFAAIGSAVENEADTQQLQMPVTIPLLLAFFIAFYAFKAPDSQVVFWGSIIPFTSPIVMLARIPFGVPFWELALSIGLLLVTFIAMAYVSAKIYKVGILMYGKKTTFRDLYKWLKQK